MTDLPVATAGAAVLLLGGVSVAASLLAAPREIVILANAALLGVGVFLLRRGLTRSPWD